MVIEFRENPYCEGNIQVILNGWNHVASIDKFNGKVTYITAVAESVKVAIISKMKELQNEKTNN